MDTCTQSAQSEYPDFLILSNCTTPTTPIPLPLDSTSHLHRKECGDDHLENILPLSRTSMGLDIMRLSSRLLTREHTLSLAISSGKHQLSLATLLDCNYNYRDCFKRSLNLLQQHIHSDGDDLLQFHQFIHFLYIFTYCLTFKCFKSLYCLRLFTFFNFFVITSRYNM